MNFKNTIKYSYDDRRLYRWFIALAVGSVIFCSPFWIDSLGQKIGPTLGRVAFELAHPDQLGKMTYTKQ